MRHILESGSIQHHVAAGGPVLLGEMEQTAREGEHAAGGSQSATLHPHGIVMNWGPRMVIRII